MRADIYNGGKYLRRLALIGGQMRSPETALYLPDAHEGLIAGTMAVNRVVRGLTAAAEGYEAAERRLARPAPDQWVDGVDGDGQPTLIENPLWAAWAAAQALAGGADAALLLLVRTRGDALNEGEAGYELALPALPEFNPRTETADWLDGAWVVRALTEDELSWHPLRPAKFMPKMGFAALLIDTLGDTMGRAILGMFADTLALATDIDWIDVFTFINGDPTKPGYAAQLLSEEAVTEANVTGLAHGWTRACQA